MRFVLELRKNSGRTGVAWAKIEADNWHDLIDAITEVASALAAEADDADCFKDGS
jgi:hypothetical protein